MAFGRRLMFKETGLLYRQMAYLFRSGATLREVIAILHDESKEAPIRKMTESVLTNLSQGVSVEESLGAHPGFFNRTLRYLLAQTGNKEKISEFLFQYADEIERIDSIKAKLLQALVYPFKLLLVAIVILAIITVFVMPVFQETFDAFGSTLPAMTRLVLTVSTAAKEYLAIVIAAMAGIVVFIIQSKRTLYTIGSFLPGIRNLLDDFSAYTFSIYLSILLPLKRPLSETLQQAAHMIPDRAYSRRVALAGQQVTDMAQFTETAAQNKLLPNLFCRALSIGKKTQAIDKLLADQSRYLERRLSNRVEIALNTIETIAMVLIGILVGTLVIALYLPIFRLAGAIS